MNAITKALWFVESNLSREIDLDEIASAAGVSRFHLTRAFGQSLGRSVIRYLRGRRLTEAAKALSCGAPDILSVALDAGYGSHEAFTRAFRDEFGVTPEQYRASPDFPAIKLVEAILMGDQSEITLNEPRIFDAEPMLMTGIGQRYEYDSMAGIPSQWERFNQYAGSIPGEVPGAAFGVCTNADSNGLDYISAVQVRDFSDVDKDFTRLRIPPQTFAIFTHHGHISEIRSVWHAIWTEWLPKSGYTVADAPSLERYGQAFDPQTGKGGFEIWLPVKS